MKNRVFFILVLLITACWITVACSMDSPIVSDGSSSSTSTQADSTPVLALSQSALSLTAGQSVALELTTNFSLSSSAEWVSSDNSVATVNNGTVTAVSCGTTTITASADGLSASCTVTVTLSDIPASAVLVSPSSPTLSAVGQTVQLSANVSPSNATNVSYSWSSSNSSVATVSASGLVTAVGQGSAVITLTTNNGLSSTATITVSLPATTKSVYTVSSSKCVGCGHCVSACPNGAITISGGKAYINASKCTACGACSSRCGRGAISMTTVTVN